MNLAVWIERNGTRFGNQAAIADGHEVYADWRSFAGAVSSLAGALMNEYGLRPGDRLAIVMNNSPQYLGRCSRPGTPAWWWSR